MAESRAIYNMRITPGTGYLSGPEGLRAQQEALSSGHNRCSRVIVNIVGRERQGKTSLRKMLAGEAFDPSEESTVGIDQALVDTTGLEPETSWSTIDMHQANLEEFDIILGKHVLKRLKLGAKTMGAKGVLAPLLCFTKIGVVAYLCLSLYFTARSCESLNGIPWFVCFVVGLFCCSGIAFGTKEGFGIAVGIFHQIILCESLVRWRIEDWFTGLKSHYGFTCAIFIGFLFYGIIETLAALSFGMSLGVGIVLMFCLAQPPPLDNNDGISIVLSPYIFMFIFGCYISLGSLRYRFALYYIVAPSLAVALSFLPQQCSFLLMCGVGCGQSHGIFLSIGQNIFIVLNRHIQNVVSSRLGRRLLRHIIGLAPGYILINAFGWNIEALTFWNISLAISVVVILEALNYFTGGKGGPRTSCIQPSRLLTTRVKNSYFKFVFRDFAGHPLYQTAHHLYMSGQCVYILVFSLLEASNSFDSTMSSLLHWLYSIYVHNNFPEVRVFIVGSHRDSPSLTSSVIQAIGRRLKDALPRDFHNMVVWNTDDTPLFPVENSVRNDKDQDHANLRNRIIQEVRTVNAQSYPLRFFYFFTLVETCRKEGTLVMKYRELFEMCRNNQCKVSSEEEFDELLSFFVTTGEIIHNTKDNILREFVIFDPQAMVTILSRLVMVPKMCNRKRTMMQAWNLLDTFGICTETLLKENLLKVYNSPSTFDNFEQAVYVLERFNLLCTLQAKPGQGNGERLFLIPALLPLELPLLGNLWEEVDSDDVFYVQCMPSLPLTVFHKLICRCAADDTSITADDNSVVLNACQTRALLTYKNVCSYKLELVGAKSEQIGITSKDTPICPHMYLKVVIRSDGCSQQVVELLWGYLTSIVRRDFAKCRLKLGVKCPCEQPHQDSQHALHVLPLLAYPMSKDDPEDDNNATPLKQFWCRGRKVDVRNGKSTIVMGLSPAVVPPQRHSHSTLLCDLPYTVVSRVCDCLNIPSPTGRDWTYLAGFLGKTLRDVELLKFRCPRDPCDALLQDWMSRDPGVTVGHLVAVLETIERRDAISELGF